MDEDIYRETYHEFNPTRCAFEKAILTRRCLCPHAHKFCLAEREGVACQSPAHQPDCQKFLQLVRQKALFALKLTSSGGNLPHAKEIKIQLGGLAGLAMAIPGHEDAGMVNDIQALLSTAKQHFGGYEELPFPSLIRQVSQLQTRKRQPRKR